MSELRGCELYFDCFAGIAGDMTLGALLDLGVPEDVVRKELAKLPVSGWRLERERVQRGALVGTKIHVRITPARGHEREHSHEHPNAHAREGEHSHAHEREREHSHEHSNAHEREHSHEHSSAHEREGEHSHEHAHSDEDEHEHEHEHSHEHDAARAHLHEDEHSPPHDHAHEHPHRHEHPVHDPRHAHAGKHAHAHTHYRDIKRMLEQHLDGDVRARALHIFDRIAVVEARLHGMSVDEVAFHEVGAIDSIVDIVGAAAALAWLAPSRITSRRVPLGGGTVDTAHGRLPVPAPATLELLTGADVEAGGDSELTTPTGAGILAASVVGYGVMPAMRVIAVGWGAGDRELADRPNLLRVVAGVRAGASEAVDCVIVEANIDDMNPEWCEPLTEALFGAGALDVWITPILMKKGRPAITVAALCPVSDRDRVAATMLRESTTIGVRFSSVTRRTLERRVVEVETPWGRVPIKVAGESEAGGRAVNAAPEHAVCRRIAEAAGVPIKRVYAEALAAFYRPRG